MNIELSETDIFRIAGRVKAVLIDQDNYEPADVPGCSHCGSAPPGDILTVSELADLLKVTPAWVYNAVFHKRLPFFKAGKHLRFFKNQVLDSLQVESSGLSTER